MIANPCVVPNNSTSSALTANSTFEGTWTPCVLYSSVVVACLTDQTGTLYLDFSPGPDSSGTYYQDSTLTFAISGSTNDVHRITVTRPYFRIRVVNGSTNQTYLRLSVMLGHATALNSPLNSSVQQDADAVVARTTTDEVSVMTNHFVGMRILSRFGRNPDVDGAEDLWSGGGNYAGFPTSAAEEFQVLSSSVNDASGGSGARTLRVYYYNSNYEMFDSSGNYLYFDVTLNGTNAVNSGVTGMRVWRALVLTSGATGSNEGTITVRWRTTTSVIFCVIPIGFANTQIGVFTVPAGYTGYLKRYDYTMDDTTSNQASMAIKVRDFGSSTSRLIRPVSVSTSKNYSASLYGGVEFSEKTDIAFRCTAVTNANAIITVSFGILLVKN